MVVNLHPTIPLLIRESKCMAKMGIEIPIVAKTLLFKQSHFDTISDSLNVRKVFLDKCFILLEGQWWSETLKSEHSSRYSI